MAIDTAILVKVMTLRNMDMLRYDPQYYLTFNQEEYDAMLKSIFTENIIGILDTEKTEIITDHINMCRGDGKHNVNWRNVIEDIINYANYGDDKQQYEYWFADRFSRTIAMQKIEAVTEHCANDAEEDNDAELSAEDAFRFYEEQYSNLGR